MKTKSLACALLLALLPAAAAHAQQTAGPLAAPAQPDNPPLSATPQADTEAAPLERFSAPFHALYDAGVLVTADFYDDFQGNPVGGLQQGHANAGAGTLGADVDLAKFAGIPGGRFHVLFTYEYGETLQKDLGILVKSQDWFLPGQKTQLAAFAYEQNLFDGKLNLYGGRVSASTMFARPTFGCDFVSGSQCPYALPLFTGGFSGFPYATWGGRVRVNPTDKFYIETGGFAVDPNRRNTGGFELGRDTTTTGVVVPVEVGYETDFGNDPYPRHYKFGGWYNSAPSTDPLLNTDRQPRALLGGAPLTNTFGRGGIYGLFDQVIYRPDSSRRNLAVFGSFSAPFDQRELLSAQNTIGLYDTGPLASRPHDTAGFMITQLVFTKAETTFMNQLLQKNGSSSFVNRDQFEIEANYGYQVTPGVVITPNVEYVVNPDTTQRPDARSAPKDALILGLRLTLKLDDALGLPSALAKPH